MTDITYFAAGCFWGVESSFQKHPQISATEVGYMGGTTKQPSYEDICSGKTGHAETVKLAFDCPYEDLLEIFWNCHDATQLNRQGLDIGTQYRSAIFCADDKQLSAAQSAKKALIEADQKIVTEIMPPPVLEFFKAEDYHQNYFAKRKNGA